MEAIKINEIVRCKVIYNFVSLTINMLDIDRPIQVEQVVNSSYNIFALSTTLRRPQKIMNNSFRVNMKLNIFKTFY